MNRLLASEMAKRVRTEIVSQQYHNITRFMSSVEKAFIASGARPIAVIISQIDWDNRLQVLDDTSDYRDASIGECQHLFTTLGYPSNCFRCREGEGQSNEHYLQVCLPHPFNMR
jgi:hypothetical protein